MSLRSGSTKEVQSSSSDDEETRSQHGRKEKQPTYILRRDLKSIRESLGYTVDEIAWQTGVSRGTVLNAEARKEVGADTARSLAEFYRLDFSAILDQVILPPPHPQGILSWFVGEMGEVLTASNGIQWRVCELNHRFVKNLKRRGKLYDLRQFVHNAQVWKKMEAHLSRHCEVCNRIGDHPNIARSHDVFCEEPNRALWWVLDDWIDGTTLEARLGQGPLQMPELVQCMAGIASGLQALHKVGVIRRELSPRFVYLTADRAILTDFELAKLLDASPTVRPQFGWPDDPYRAPEVRDSANPDSSWDLYSWAMILAFAISAKKPAGPSEAMTSLKRATMPHEVRAFALKCLGPQNKRPKDFLAIQSWFDSAK